MSHSGKVNWNKNKSRFQVDVRSYHLKDNCSCVFIGDSISLLEGETFGTRQNIKEPCRSFIFHWKLKAMIDMKGRWKISKMYSNSYIHNKLTINENNK